MAIRENFTYTDMDLWLNEKRVTEIECLVPDLTGVARGKILPRGKFTQERGMRIPGSGAGHDRHRQLPDRRWATTAPSPAPTAT
jgi:glutamine synthetase